GLPDPVPGVTVGRQCGSSQRAVHVAAQAVTSGTADAVLAGAVQNMSRVPISAAMLAGQQYGFDDPFSGSEGWRKRYGETEVSQFRSADMIARHWALTRRQMEEYAHRRHQRAVTAMEEGRVDREITPEGEFRTDETPRRGTTMEKMATLEPLSEGSPMTAAVASQISDAASATMIASEEFVNEHKLTPRARIHHLTVAAADPVWML